MQKLDEKMNELKLLKVELRSAKASSATETPSTKRIKSSKTATASKISVLQSGQNDQGPVK